MPTNMGGRSILIFGLGLGLESAEFEGPRASAKVAELHEVRLEVACPALAKSTERRNLHRFRRSFLLAALRFTHESN